MSLIEPNPPPREQVQRHPQMQAFNQEVHDAARNPERNNETIGEWARGYPDRERALEEACIGARYLMNESTEEDRVHLARAERRQNEILAAQTSNQPTISFNMMPAQTTQGEQHFFVRGASTAGYCSDGTHTITYQIPTPAAPNDPYHQQGQWGCFHDIIAVPIEPQPGSHWTTADNVTGQTCAGTYYLQTGNWVGPYTVTIPADGLTTFINTYPNHVYSNPLTASNTSTPEIWRGRNDAHEVIPDTPERNFEALVNRHEIEFAYIKSKELVKEWLTDEEYYALMKFHSLIVRSKLFPNIDYIIDVDDKVYIDAYNGDVGKVEARFCIHTRDSSFQLYDRLLARVLLLKADESEFIRQANQHDGDVTTPRRFREIIPPLIRRL